MIMDGVCSSDRDLLDTFVAGSALGFEELVARYETKVFALCNSLSRNSSDAEEILADVFCEAYSVLPTLEQNCSIPLWIFKRTIELALERREKLEIIDGSANSSSDALAVATDSCEAFINGFGAISKKLPSEYLVVFLLSDILALDSAEVSEIIDTSELEVKAYLHRARLMVVRHLPNCIAAHSMCFLPPGRENSAAAAVNASIPLVFAGE